MRNLFYAEVTHDIPYGIFSILLRMIEGIDGFCEPFVNFGRNKKAEVVSFHTYVQSNSFFLYFPGRARKKWCPISNEP